MFEVIFLDGTIQEVKQCFLCSYVKLYKSKIIAYRKIKSYKAVNHLDN